MKKRNNIKQSLAVEVKFMGPTNFLGARVKLSIPLQSKSITLDYDYAIARVLDQAILYLQSKGNKIESFIQYKDNYIINVKAVNYSLICNL